MSKRIKRVSLELPEATKVDRQTRQTALFKFEDAATRVVALDPKRPAQAVFVWIFDNIVERASREMMRNLV